MSTVPDHQVSVMKLLDYDPNVPLVDADKHQTEQQLMHELSLRAEARLALFMAGCRQLRESDPARWQTALAAFTNTLVDVLFEGRVDLQNTERHKNVMKLVLNSTLANLVTSHNPDQPAL